MAKKKRDKQAEESKPPSKSRERYLAKRKARRAQERRKQAVTWLRIAAVVVLVFGGLAWGINLLDSPQTETTSLSAEVSVDEAYAMYQEGAFVLDVRTQEEWDEYHAPGTTLIPLDELASRTDEVPSDQDVVVVCRSGNRSQEGRDILLGAGLDRVTSMNGGLSDWRDAGYPVE